MQEDSYKYRKVNDYSPKSQYFITTACFSWSLLAFFLTKCFRPMKYGFRSNFHWGINWIYQVVLALYKQVTSCACYKVTSNFSIWSVVLVTYQLGFRGDYFFFSLSVNCGSRAFTSFILDISLASLIGLSCCPIFFLFFSFSFFNNARCLVLLLCLCFLSFLCQNFLTFFSPASSDSTLVAMGYQFAMIPKATSALIPG